MRLFLPYQERWVFDRSPVKVMEKSRRTGITWCTAYEAVECASAQRGCNTWYQTYAEDDAKEFIEDVGKFARACSAVFDVHTEELGEEESNEFFLLPEGTRSVKITSVRFRSGHKVTALPHSPRKLRGKDGYYILDEAAFHDDMAGALKAAHAFRMWGGRVAIISTHNGVESEFNKLVLDVTEGRKNYSHHRVTLLDAVKEGLYRRICLVRGIDWSPEDERLWVDDLLSEEGADEELLCIPARGAQVYLPRALVEAAMTNDFPVIRWHAPDKFLFDPEQRQKVDSWLDTNIIPLVYRLSGKKLHCMGQDFGRSADGSVYAIGEEDGGQLNTRFMVELWNMPYAAQEQVFLRLATKIPRFRFAAMDATGNGEKMGEVALVKLGESRAEAVKMTEKWYGENLPELKARFEKPSIRIPRDDDVRQDLSMFQKINGVPRLPKIRMDAVRKNAARGEKRHGDAGIALALLAFAAKRPHLSTTGYQAAPKNAGHFARKGIW